MAKPKIPNQKGKYDSLNKRLADYVALVRQIYDVLNLEAAKMAESVGYNDDGDVFSFRNYPQLKDRLAKLQSRFVSDISGVIYSGTSREWKESNLIQDLVADKVLKTYGIHSKSGRYKKYYQTNSDALKAFQERKDRGMNLSKKIWNQSENYKQELEYAISSAIQKGMSAVTLSKRVSKYLQDFKSLQKDYKEKFGKSVDCHDCEYRSIRLARSEINLAYRTAEQKRWEQFDFVVGQEIKLSNNHTCNGLPFTDICDDLKGKYPKDFKFTGWHPMCRCYVIPILKTEDEFWADEDLHSKNEIQDTPTQFKDWVRNNKERINKAKEKGTLPYFVKDNPSYVRQNKTIKEITQERHANRNEAAIRQAARNRYLLDVGNINNEDIARLRRNARIYDVDITEFNNYIYSHKFKESYDLITDKESLDLQALYDKYNKLILKKAIDFDNEKDTLIAFVNGNYQFGNFGQKAIKSIRAINISDKKPFKVALKELEDYKSYLLTEYKNFRNTPINLVVDYDVFDMTAFNHATTQVDIYQEMSGMLRSIYGENFAKSHIYIKFNETLNKTNDFLEAYKEFTNEYRKNIVDIYDSINRLSEIKKADLSMIYKSWVGRFNDYIAKINSFDIKKDGYAGIYREIEGAYNILKLSSDKRCIQYGLGKLSCNTPYKLIDEYSKIFKNPFALIGNKDFYDSFEIFVPTTIRYSGNAYYSPVYNHVRFCITDRIKNSRVYAEMIQYHEYGHAMDRLQGNWSSDKKWIDLYNKYADRLNKDKGFDYNGVEYNGVKVKEKYWDAYISSYQTYDDEEFAGALSDIIVAFDEKHEIFGHRHHDFDYFNDKSSQLAEFIAHASELFWQGNPIFAKAYPSLYNELKSMYGDFFKLYRNKIH